MEGWRDGGKGRGKVGRQRGLGKTGWVKDQAKEDDRGRKSEEKAKKIARGIGECPKY